MAVNFDQYLDTPVESAEAPTAPPVGHYFADIIKWTQEEVDYKKDGSKTPVVKLTFKITSADSDVDPDQSPEKAIGRLVDKNYTLNEDGGRFALRQVGEVACGLDAKGLSFKDMLPLLVGQPVKLALDQRAGKDEGTFYPDVKKVLSANG